MENGFDSSLGWAIGLAGFAFGIALGAGISLLLGGGRKRVHQLEEQLAELERQYDKYRHEVTQHFRTTSELVQKMTDSYRDVYEHLAGGSQALCRTRLGGSSLEFTRQPLLDNEAPPEPPHDPEFADAETDPLQEESDSDTCMGDAPRVPQLDIGERAASDASVSPRTP